MIKVKILENTVNTLTIQLENKFSLLTLYYSYTTIIGFRYNGTLWLSENIWSNTTGKHINKISRNKNDRLPRYIFETELKEIMEMF